MAKKEFILRSGGYFFYEAIYGDPSKVIKQRDALNALAMHLNGEIYFNEREKRFWEQISPLFFSVTMPKNIMALYHSRYEFEKLWMMHPIIELAEFHRIGMDTTIAKEIETFGINSKISAKQYMIYSGLFSAIMAKGTGPPRLSLMMALVRYYYFPPGDGWRRLKICQQCDKWFVDLSKNRTQSFCSKHCKDHWWSWTRRKQANHRLMKK
jgi:hypothetical protein